MSRRERLLLSVQELDRKIEGRLHKDRLIGVVVAVKTSQSEQTIVRPRPVTFGWQRGIKIGECAHVPYLTLISLSVGLKSSDEVRCTSGRSFLA